MSQTRDIMLKSAEMINKILVHQPDDKPRQLLMWRIREQVIDLQKSIRANSKSASLDSQKYSIFISQSYGDDWTQPVRDAAVQCLEDRGITAVIANQETLHGSTTVDRVLSLIRSSQGMLCVLTSSKADPHVPSSWQITEIAMALACGKPIGFVVDDLVNKWASTHYGALYNFVKCEPGEHLRQVLHEKVSKAVDLLEAEICSLHILEVK